MHPILLLAIGSSSLAIGSGGSTPKQRPLKSAVVTDMDGTLFSFAGRDLSPGNRAALLRCIEQGVHVCVATGRIPGPWFEQLKEQVPGLGPSVFGNGAMVCDADGSVLWVSTLPSEIVSTVLEYTRGGTAGEGGGRLCVLAATHWTEGEQAGVRYCELSPAGEPSEITALIERAGEPDAVLLQSLDGFEGRQVLKFVIWTVPGEDGWASMPSTVADLKRSLAGTGATILDHGERWCEILSPGVNKGEGVLRLLEKLGVAPADVLACGDAENDVEMLRVVGVGAAMGNAQPAALAAADVVVAKNSEDGVAEAIRRFVLPPANLDEAAPTRGETTPTDEAATTGDEPTPALEFFTLDMCPYAQRCWIVLEELGVPYEARKVDLRGNAEEKAWFLKNVNPRGKVPALRDPANGGLVLFESIIINEYLAEQYGSRGAHPSLLPSDAAARARIRLWNEHLDTQLAPAHFTLLMSKEAEGSEGAQAQREALDKALAVYEEGLVGPFLTGGDFTLADCAALPFFERLVFSLSHYRRLDALAAFPRTRAWLETAMGRDSFAKTRRPEAKLIELYDRFLQVDYDFGGLAKK